MPETAVGTNPTRLSLSRCRQRALSLPLGPFPPISDTDAEILFHRTYANGKYCGQYVHITRLDTGDSIKALVADSCPSCTSRPLRRRFESLQTSRS